MKRLTIMASLAQDESRKMSERTKAGIQTSQKKGTYVAGPTPFGYGASFEQCDDAESEGDCAGTDDDRTNANIRTTAGSI